LYTHLNAACLDCGFRAPYSITAIACPKCGSQWRAAEYDYEKARLSWPDCLAGRSFDLWRYRELLPVNSPNPSTYMGEGGTPLFHAINLGMMLGCPNIYIKDERQGPTASFKDRQAAVNIVAMKEADIAEAVIASTGNVAIAFSAYAVRAGIRLWAFLTSLVPAEKMREVALYGTQVVKVTGSYDQAKQIAAEFARQRNLFIERGARSIPSVEAMKTIAFEIAEQMTWLLGPPQPSGLGPHQPKWRVPDWYLQSVSGGTGPLGIHKGFSELLKMGLIDRIPALGVVQASGCAPMVKAWQAGQDQAEPVRTPRTHIATLATGDPGRTYTLLYHQMAQSGGVFESVSDEDTFRTMHILAKMEGVSVEPAAAVAFAGLIKLVRNGQIKPSDTVVVNCTGHTMAIESNILGEGWARDVDLTTPQLRREFPEEGLLAALNQLSVERFPRIAIVDDSPDARRLIRRILQAQGDYSLFEASDGDQAIALAQREQLDLIILDLMMPEIDGFTVLDSLKASPKTATIPVIVVTAKELTSQEKERLRGQIYSLMQKGEFLSDDLLDEVKSLVK
jgi:threonine synthase